ncbi:50S ribosomal protein L29 [Candidatus Woesearchaeota archaeon]|nr:50S ribosomal protein L29 [Candidatus Woesearchaeota archaeon]
MAIIKKSELKNLTEKQAEEKKRELQKELMKLRAQISTGTAPENPGRVKAIRKTIVRLIQKENEKKEVKKKES